MMLLLGSLTVLGQIIVFSGCKHQSFPIMFIGRIIFGYGSESLTAAQNVYITEFFEEKQLAFPISLGNAISLMGTNLNYIFTAQIAKNFGVSMGFLIGVFFCTFSFLCIICAVGLDYYIENKIAERVEGSLEDCEKKAFLINSNEQIEEKNDGQNFPNSFWPLLICSMVIYASNIGFNSIAVSFFVEKWFPNQDVKLAEIASAKIISLNSLTTALTSILLAFFMPFMNNFLGIFNCFTAFMMLFSFILFFFAVYPWVSLLLNGIGSSLNYNILNTLIPLMISPKNLGMAYGLSVAANNLGTSITPFMTALLRNYSNNYDLAIIFFIVMNILGAISAGIFLCLRKKEEKIECKNNI